MRGLCLCWMCALALAFAGCGDSGDSSGGNGGGAGQGGAGGDGGAAGGTGGTGGAVFDLDAACEYSCDCSMVMGCLEGCAETVAGCEDEFIALQQCLITNETCNSAAPQCTEEFDGFRICIGL